MVGIVDSRIVKMSEDNHGASLLVRPGDGLRREGRFDSEWQSHHYDVPNAVG